MGLRVERPLRVVLSRLSGSRLQRRLNNVYYFVSLFFFLSESCAIADSEIRFTHRSNCRHWKGPYVYQKLDGTHVDANDEPVCENADTMTTMISVASHFLTADLSFKCRYCGYVFEQVCMHEDTCKRYRRDLSEKVDGTYVATKKDKVQPINVVDLDQLAAHADQLAFEGMCGMIRFYELMMATSFQMKSVDWDLGVAFCATLVCPVQLKVVEHFKNSKHIGVRITEKGFRIVNKARQD